MPPPAAPAGRLTRLAALTAAVVGLASAGFAGRTFGFSSAPDLAVAAVAIGLAAAIGLRVARAFPPPPDSSTSVVRAGVVGVAAVVLCGLVLGAAHALSAFSYVVAETALAGACAAWLPRHGGRTAPVEPLSPIAIGLWIAIAASVVGMGLGHSPFDAYDSLSYHLFFPARWLQAHRLSIIPTPFGDEAQAYQPANGELWLAWLMAPFGGDFLARIGQVPFYLLAAVTAFALARRLGCAARHATYAATLVLVAPPIVEQAVGANVDLIHGALLLASLYLGVIAVDSDDRSDWAIWGVAVGLWMGSKYLAIVYAPVIALLPVVRGVRWRARWALPGIAAFALPWYLRNWIVAGSPIYPATLAIGGVTIGPGAYSHAAMTRSFLHATDPRLLLISLAHGFGPPFFVPAIAMLAAAGAAVAWRRAWWPAGYVMATIVVMPLLCWAGVGDNTDARFLLPAVLTTAAMAPVAFGRRRLLNRALHVCFLAAVAWTIAGAPVQLHPPASAPWYMSDWLSLDGTVTRWFLPAFVALAAGAAAIASLARRWRLAGATAAVFVAAGGTALAAGAERWCVPSRCDYVTVASPHLRTEYLFGSRWLTANVHHARVAYTGVNLPYLVEGSHLDNVVSYVNIDGRADWRFDQYARALAPITTRWPQPGALAQGSGLLMPMTTGPGLIDALRPRFERMHGNSVAWTASLRDRGVEYLFVMTLDPYEIDYVWHTPDGFPIEDRWAAANPMEFHLVYQNARVHIYRLVTS